MFHPLCLDQRHAKSDHGNHLVIVGEAHLRQILQSYSDYYNKVRTHRSLAKDAPAFRPVQRAGNIASRAILGGLHHHYVRI
jgi:hypothetical protein